MIEVYEYRKSPTGALPIPTQCLINPRYIMGVRPDDTKSHTEILLVNGTVVPVRERLEDVGQLLLAHDKP